MASIALAIVGSFILPGAGTVIGGAIGGVIDSQFIMPAIFGKGTDVNQPRVTDLNVQTATEGSPMKFCLGPECRTAGTVIWMTDLVEHSQKHGKGMGGGGTSYSYTLSAAVAVCEGPISRITKIWANSIVVYDVNDPNAQADKHCGSITIYTGEQTQTADPLMEAHLGVGSVPAYRGVAYVVFQDIQGQDFGNRLPNFSFAVETDESLPIKTAMTRLLKRAGMTTAQFDVSRITGCLRGYVLTGPITTLSALTPMLNAFTIRTQEKNGKLIFFPRGEERHIAITESDLGARLYKDNLGPSFKVTDPPNLNLPSEMTVSYFDPVLDYQKGSQRVVLKNAPTKASNGFDCPFVITATEASAIAKQQLWTLWGERGTAEFNLPPSYMGIQESDCLEVSYLGQSYTVRTQEATRGANYLINVKGVIEETGSMSQIGASIADPSDYVPPSVHGPDTPVFAILDLPALESPDAIRTGYYVASRATSAGQWKGAVLFTSLDGATYTQVAALTEEATMGTAATALPDGPVGFWDNYSTVNVTLDSGELESVSEALALGGNNAMLIGQEIVIFKNATLIGTNQYTLSGFIRGLRDTRSLTGSHVVGEQVVLLDRALLFVENTPASLGFMTRFKAVPTGGVVADYTEQIYTLAGNTLRPFAPWNVTGSRDGSNNLSISFKRRTRDITRVLAVSNPPLLDDVEKYEVVFTISGVSITKLVVGATTYVYTGADRTADGFTAGTTATVQVYQIGRLGRGRTSESIIV